MQVERQHDDSAGRSSWHIDQTHTSVEFEVTKFFFWKLRGRFVDVEGAVVLDEDVLSHSSVQVTIKAGSIETKNAKRDKQLRSASFLDADRFPEITFRSSSVGPGKDRDMLFIKGELTIKDTSKEVTLDVTEIDRSRSPQGEEVIYYVATTKLNRSELGVGGWFGLIGATLNVVINIQAIRN
jgi:polyisoprenoid-binding protein YceI